MDTACIHTKHLYMDSSTKTQECLSEDKQNIRPLHLVNADMLLLIFLNLIFFSIKIDGEAVCHCFLSCVSNRICLCLYVLTVQFTVGQKITNSE